MSHLQSFLHSLSQAGFDGAILSSTPSLRYLSGFDFHDGYILVAGKRAYLVTDFRYEEAARANASNEFEILCPDGDC